MQKRYVKKTGEIIWINLTASIINGPDGEPLRGRGGYAQFSPLKVPASGTMFRPYIGTRRVLATLFIPPESRPNRGMTGVKVAKRAGDPMLYAQIFLYLQLLDFLTTLVGFKLGASELSPLRALPDSIRSNRRRGGFQAPGGDDGRPLPLRWVSRTWCVGSAIGTRRSWSRYLHHPGISIARVHSGDLIPYSKAWCGFR